MPIYVSSTLQPKGGAKWPILEDVYLKGGFRVVPNIAARDLLYTNSSLKLGLKIGMIVVCADTLDWWQYIAANSWKKVTPGTSTGQVAQNMYEFSQSVASDTWNINHMMVSRSFTYTIFDLDGKEVSADSCVIKDENNLTLSFFSSQAGKATFAFKL